MRLFVMQQPARQYAKFFQYVMMITMLTACGTAGYSGTSLHAAVKNKQSISNLSYVEGQLLVVFVTGISDAEARAVMAGIGGSVIRVISASRMYQVQLADGMSVENELPRYRKLSGVAYAEPNYRRKLR